MRLVVLASFLLLVPARIAGACGAAPCSFGLHQPSTPNFAGNAVRFRIEPTTFDAIANSVYIIDPQGRRTEVVLRDGTWIEPAQPLASAGQDYQVYSLHFDGRCVALPGITQPSPPTPTELAFFVGPEAPEPARLLDGVSVVG